MKHMAKTLKKSGIVQSFNISPKGTYEGLLLKDKNTTVQINFPPHLSSVISESVKVGSKLQVSATDWPTDKPQDHPVFELVEVEGKALNESNGSFSGVITRLNYALHGEVNGGILDSGDFLHLKPKGAAAVGIEVGLKVKGHGSRKPMVGNKSVIEADEVNGIKIDHKPKPKKS
jgi:hypothetical protein